MRIGYACMNLVLGTRSRTCRLANVTPERVASLARENLEDVRRMARWNARHGVGILRLSSGLVPFGSHPGSGDWRGLLRDDLQETGRVLRETDQRVSTHPGQFTVLNSPRPEVVAGAIEELRYQADMFDLMGMRGDMVIHMGGAYGDREKAFDRLQRVAASLPEGIARRLVLENDDVTWNAREAVRASRETGLPLVFDVFHHHVLPSDGLTWQEALSDALDTWPAGRRAKIHYSDQAPGKAAGAHADKVDVGAFHAFLDEAKRIGGFDVMVEAKSKEQAVIPLLRALTAGEDAGAVEA